MILEDKRDGYTQFDVSEFVQVKSNRNSHVDFMYSINMPSNTSNLMAIRTRLRDRNIHEQLKMIWLNIYNVNLIQGKMTINRLVLFMISQSMF